MHYAGWWLIVVMAVAMFTMPRKRSEKTKEAEKVKAA